MPLPRQHLSRYHQQYINRIYVSVSSFFFVISFSCQHTRQYSGGRSSLPFQKVEILLRLCHSILGKLFLEPDLPVPAPTTTGHNICYPTFCLFHHILPHILPISPYSILHSAHIAIFCPTFCPNHYILPHILLISPHFAPESAHFTTFCPTVCPYYHILPHSLPHILVTVCL